MLLDFFKHLKTTFDIESHFNDGVKWMFALTNVSLSRD